MIDTHVLERGVVKVHLEGEDDAGDCQIEFCVGHAVEVDMESVCDAVNSYSHALEKELFLLLYRELGWEWGCTGYKEREEVEEILTQH